MENITSENICRIEVTQEFLPAQVLEKKIKTENVSTRTITKLKRDLKGMVKKLKQLSILNRINTQKQKSVAVVPVQSYQTVIDFLA